MAAFVETCTTPDASPQVDRTLTGRPAVKVARRLARDLAIATLVELALTYWPMLCLAQGVDPTAPPSQVEAVTSAKDVPAAPQTPAVPGRPTFVEVVSALRRPSAPARAERPRGQASQLRSRDLVRAACELREAAGRGVCEVGG
jgi:hypothetical protein